MLQFGRRLLQIISGKRTKRFLFGFFILTLLMTIVSPFILPSYLKRLAIEQVQQQMGRKLEITDISFSPLSLTLTADGVSLFEADEKTPMLKLKRAALSLSMSSLFHRALVMDEVVIDEPSLHVIRTSADEHGRYNFSDMLERVVAMPKSATPFQFSFANVQLRGGTVQFDDQVLDQHIQVDQLQIALPFLSNFPSSSHIIVQPLLSARVNGTSFSLKGRSKPFVDSVETSLAIDIDRLDLPRYLAYLPMPLPVKLKNARLSTKLDLIFSVKNRRTELLLSGDMQIDGLSLQDKAGRPLLNVRSIKTHISQFNMLNAAASIDKLHIDTPEIWLGLDEQGQLNWNKLLHADGRNDSAAKPLTAKAPAPNQVKPVISLAELLLDHGQVHWTDAWYAAPAQSVLVSDMKFSARQFSTAINGKPSLISMNAQLEQKQELKFDGEFNPASGDVTGLVSVNALQLGFYQGYLKRFLAAQLNGVVSLKTHIKLYQGNVTLNDMGLKIDKLALQPNAKNEGQVVINSIELDKLNMSTETRTVGISGISINEMTADVRRDANAKLSVTKLFLPFPSGPPVPTVNAPGAAALTSADTVLVQDNLQRDWLVTLQDFKMNESSFSFTDHTVSPAVTSKAEGIKLIASNLSSDLSQAMKLTWTSSLNRKGKLSFIAHSTPKLRQISVDLDGKLLPVASLYPYFSHLLNVELLSGRASLKGVLNLKNDEGKALVTNYEGMLSLNDFKILENGESEDFLYWKSISLDGISLSLGGAKEFVFLRKLALDDFYAKLVLSEKGELNIGDILVHKNTAINAATRVSEEAVQRNSMANEPKSIDSPVEIRIAQTTLNGGNINFSDNFIQPNYRANLTGVSGNIGSVSSMKPEAAALQLVGKIDGDAPLLISGSVNPLSKPIFVDIKGSANSVQLTRMSPYAAKYAGYPIVKGQLSVQIAYHVENEKLLAENEVKLDQLTFGEKVESPDATSLPVNLALALLRDNDGQIAINLPVSGALSDPQFSIGGLIFKVFVNIVTKAVTSPFALLGAAFGGGEELAYIEFAPGRSTLTPATVTKLDHLVTALSERSKLKLDITGRVDPKTDSEGLRLDSLDNKIKAFKLRDLRKKTASIQADEVRIEEADRRNYIEEVYRAEEFTKQRNLIGIAKTLPPQEAMTLVLSHILVSEENLRSLAQRRADVVLEYLEMKGRINKDRLFLIAPKLNVDDLKDKGLPNRVDFSLK